jgi:hypothetical protein
MNTPHAPLAALCEALNSKLESLPLAKRPRLASHAVIVRFDPAGRGIEALDANGWTEGMSVSRAKSLLSRLSA